ncbi:hypothetical protein [Lysobacter gummosus]
MHLQDCESEHAANAATLLQPAMSRLYCLSAAQRRPPSPGARP